MSAINLEIASRLSGRREAPFLWCLRINFCWYWLAFRYRAWHAAQYRHFYKIIHYQRKARKQCGNQGISQSCDINRADRNIKLEAALRCVLDAISYMKAWNTLWIMWHYYIMQSLTYLYQHDIFIVSQKYVIINRAVSRLQMHYQHHRITTVMPPCRQST